MHILTLIHVTTGTWVAASAVAATGPDERILP